MEIDNSFNNHSNHINKIYFYWKIKNKCTTLSKLLENLWNSNEIHPFNKAYDKMIVNKQTQYNYITILMYS